MKSKLKYLIILLALIIAVVVFVIVSRTNAMNNKEVTIYIGNEEVVLDYESEDTIIDLKSFTSEFDTIVKENSLWHKVKVNGEKVSGKKNLGEIDIERDATLEIDVQYADGETKKYIINLLPSTFPKYTVKGESEYEGDYYTSTYSFKYDDDHYIFKMDEEGDIIFYKKTNMVAFDFQKQVNSKGEVRYIYLESVDTNFDGVSSLLPCHIVVLDEHYNEIDRITHLVSDGKELKLENHGYMYLDDDHYILVAYETVTDKVDGEEYNIYNCVIQEVKNGKVLWEFRSNDYKELYDYSTLDKLDYSKKYQDYAHFNSMDIDKDDGNLLTSFRNIDAVLKINRETGKLMWILSGEGDDFDLTEDEKSSKQHSVVSLGNGKILIYDNGNKVGRSRIVEYTIDEEKMKLLDFKEYDTELYAMMMGSVRVLDEDIYLICYGGMGYNKSSIQEVNTKTGEVYFEFTFNNIRSMYNVNKYE